MKPADVELCTSELLQRLSRGARLYCTVLYCSAGALYSLRAQLQRRVGPEAYGNIVVWKADEVFVRVGHEMRALLLEELLEVETRALELIGAQLRTHTVTQYVLVLVALVPVCTIMYIRTNTVQYVLCV